MTTTLQLENAIYLHDEPRLLIEWTPRWQGFVTSIRPAFARSGPRLAGEAPNGISPYRGMIAAMLLQAFLLFVVIILPGKIAHLRPYAAPRVRPYEVIYYSGDELPRTEDLGGAQAGASGRAGGHEAHHRTQTIHVARGGSLSPRVVDAPDLKLPSTAGAVANLLAFKAKPAPNPGPPPSEGLHSSLTAPRLPVNVVAPAPANVARDQSRRGLTLDAVVPPAPNVSSDKSRSTPALDAAVVPPAPSVRSDHTLVAPALDPSIIAPAPRLSRERTSAAPALDSAVIPPAPSAVSREVSSTRVQMNNDAVVPPPVSAPERETSRNAKLNLPAPSVVAPPPSADSAHDLRRLESGSAADPSAAVVPPPPTQANGSFVSTVIGKLFGTQDVVPPPPSSAGASGTARTAPGGSLANNVVPPPPSISGSGAAGGSSPARARGSSLGTSNVIPPPPSVGASGPGQGSPSGPGNSAAPGNGTQLASNVVPPPPSIGSGTLSGSGRKGNGLGGPGDSGSVLAPPGGGGSNGGSGVVLSPQPGSTVGMPGGNKGSLAMSPSGGDKPGLGGSGGGAGIGHGEGSGSGLTGDKSGAGSGADKTATGVGSDAGARGGISPTPGPGGAGSAPTGSPAVPGVDVRGGSTYVVNLPSFGADGNASAPTTPGHSPAMPKDGAAITIVATSRSGGAFDFYGKLPGDNYTVYVDTSLGMVVMQFAEVNPVPHTPAGSSTGALVGPRGYATDLPANLPHARVVIKCTLDTSGKLQHFQVLEPGPAGMTAKILAALPNWKFRPAMRGTQPVEVNAYLGFNIDTNDRF
ncbi:MAG TPA: hypothetical protein VK706_05490 [Candidatus Sulfotelmatobacter sp.]|nr:hypothetical protein [Candidatus Sulfotelmatobacter sp.]